MRDSANFDDWQFFEAEGLRLRFATVLEKLVTLLIATQAWDQAISYARRWLALDSLHEPAHRQLMRLYAWNEQQAAALRQYRECVRILDEELGAPPLEETTDLYHLIQENRLEPPPTASVAPSLPTENPPRQLVLPPANQPPAALVGRTVELTRLYQSYDTTTGGRLIVIQGEAGIGKTRLAQELLRHVRERDGVILSAQCYEGETNLAFAPILNAIRPALAQPQSASRLEAVAPHALSEAARLLPEITRMYELPPAQSVDSPGAQSRFFDGLSQTLDALLGGPAPGVLFIDNVHWADAASLDLLAYLIRRLRQHDWLLLLTWRSEHVTEMQQLPRLAREIQRENLAECYGTATSGAGRCGHAGPKIYRNRPGRNPERAALSRDRGLALHADRIPFSVGE